MVKKRKVSIARRVSPRAWVGLAAFALLIATAAAGMPSAAKRVPPPRMGHKPLTAEERIARDRYWASRRGLQFGVPKHAYRDAVSAMRRMEAAQRGSRSLAATPPYTWNFIGPMPMLNDESNFGGAIVGFNYDGSGRITAVAPDPGNIARIVVGAASGGVWLSTDTGNTFTPIGDSLPTTAIGAIALDSVNTSPPTIYVATGEGNDGGDNYYGQGIFKSTDLGQTWLSLTSNHLGNVAFSRLVVDTTHNPPTLFAAASTQGTSARADPFFPVGNPVDQGLWRSTDGGNNWTRYPASTFGCLSGSSGSNPCPAEDVAIDPSFPQSVYAAIQGDNVFHSTDGGNTWAPVCFTNDAPSCSFPSKLGQMDRASVVVANRTVYAMIGAQDNGEYVAFYKSTNDGVTWTAETVPTVGISVGGNSATIDGTSSSNFSQEFYDQALLIDPADASGNTVFFGGVGIYESTDGGASWSFLADSGGVHSDQHALAVAPDNDTIYLGNDGGLFRFSISGITAGTANFTALNDTLQVGQIQGIGPHPTDSSKVLAGFQDNGTQLYSGSPGWATVETGDGGFTLFDQVNPAFAYHTYATTGGSQVTLGFSQDGGSTWTHSNFSAVGETFAFYPPLASDPGTAQRVLIGGHKIYVLDGLHPENSAEMR